MSTSRPAAGSPDDAPPEISVAWDITSYGSARFRLLGAGDALVVGTSYIGDGLESLVSAALDLRRGADATWCMLPDEPIWTGLFFSGAGDDVYLQAALFDSHMSDDIWAGGHIRWKGRIPTHAFCAQVATAAETALADCGGEDGYLRAWGDIPFPTNKLRGLRQLL